MSFITSPKKLAEWIKSYPTEKKCCRCKLTKSVSEFGRRKNPRYSLEVYMGYCYPCTRLIRKEKKPHIKYHERYPWVRNYGFAKARCRKNGREITLKIEDFKKLWFRDEAWNFKTPSIDRIDPTKGYIHGNCRFIENSMNQALGTIMPRKTSKKRSPAWCIISPSGDLVGVSLDKTEDSVLCLVTYPNKNHKL